MSRSEPTTSTKRLGQSLAFRYIVAAARCGSIRKAGELLNVSSTSLTRKIIEFETSLGGPVFERFARGVKLTAAGQKLIDYIHEQEMCLDQTISEIKDLQNGDSAHIKIATAEVAPRTFLAGQLAAFHKRRPKVSYELRISASYRVEQSIREDEATVGLAIEPAHDDTLTTVSQMSFFPHVLVSSSHPLSQSNFLTVEDCKEYPIAMYDSSFEQRPSAAAQQLLHDVPSAMRTNSIELLTQVAEESSMICCGVYYPSNVPQRLGSLTTIPFILHGNGQAKLALLIKRGRPLSAATSDFVNQLKEYMNSSE